MPISGIGTALTIGSTLARVLVRKEGYSVGAIPFDLILSEEHNLENIVTTHRVEEGSEITDNIRKKLREGSLTGWVSNHSIQFGALGADSFKLPTSASDILENGALVDRVKQTYDLFVELWKTGQTVSIVTILEKEAYKSVAIKNVGIRRDSTDADSQRFEVTFRQIETAQIKQVGLSSNIKPDGTGTDLGRQTSLTSNQGRTIGT